MELVKHGFKVTGINEVVPEILTDSTGVAYFRVKVDGAYVSSDCFTREQFAELAEAVALVQRELSGEAAPARAPDRLIDSSGDEWYRLADGQYVMHDGGPHTRDMLEERYGPIRPA